MSNEKRPHKGGHSKPGHSGKPGNGKFGQGSGQGGAKRKRRRRSGAGNGSGSGVSEQNRQQKWDNNSRGDKKRFEPRGENRHENRRSGTTAPAANRAPAAALTA